EPEALFFAHRPRERPVGGREVRISDDLCVRQVRADLLFGQPPVVLRDEKASCRTCEDAAPVPARPVRRPKMVGGFLAYQCVRYPEVSAEVAEVQPVVVVPLRDDY